MAHQFQARIVWTGAAQGPTVTYKGYSREFLAEIDGKPPLRGSSAPVYMGDAGLHNPEDLLVISLSTCHMLWYLHLCTDVGIQVRGYSDDAEGTLEMADGKMVFTNVLLRPRVILEQGDIQQALHLHHAASEACFIANSMNFPVTHQAEIL